MLELLSGVTAMGAMINDVVEQRQDFRGSTNSHCCEDSDVSLRLGRCASQVDMEKDG